ncbi:hypothetical protein ABW20_dc0102422 [Dactylellina cionopaga]|nr:hypothetical protein ABW20_dc0102422 [Dactylellina cionopaga]
MTQEELKLLGDPWEQKLAEDSPEVSKEASEEIPEEASKEIPEEASKEIPEASKGIPEKASKQISEETSEEIPEENLDPLATVQPPFLRSLYFSLSNTQELTYFNEILANLSSEDREFIGPFISNDEIYERAQKDIKYPVTLETLELEIDALVPRSLAFPRCPTFYLIQLPNLTTLTRLTLTMDTLNPAPYEDTLEDILKFPSVRELSLNLRQDIVYSGLGHFVKRFPLVHSLTLQVAGDCLSGGCFNQLRGARKLLKLTVQLPRQPYDYIVEWEARDTFFGPECEDNLEQVLFLAKGPANKNLEVYAVRDPDDRDYWDALTDLQWYGDTKEIYDNYWRPRENNYAYDSEAKEICSSKSESEFESESESESESDGRGQKYRAEGLEPEPSDEQGDVESKPGDEPEDEDEYDFGVETQESIESELDFQDIYESPYRLQDGDEEENEGGDELQWESQYSQWDSQGYIGDRR